MKMAFAMVADYVAETKEGKLVIAGEFATIMAESVPAMHPAFYLVARFETSVVRGSDHRFQIEMRDEDGREVMPRSPDIPVKFAPQAPGRPLRAHVIIQFGPTQFPRFGDYEFTLFIDGHEQGVVPITLLEFKISR